jgi:hypothetical protein
MRKISVVFVITILFGCYSSEISEGKSETLEYVDSDESKSLILFGNKESISKLVHGKIPFDDYIQIQDPYDLIISCEFNNEEGVPPHDKFLNNTKNNDLFSRNFRTFVGDRFISAGDNDSSAVTRVQLANYCLEVINNPGPFPPIIIPVVTPIEDKVYINVSFENSLTESLLRPAFELAIEEWNDAINDNQFNTYLDGSPQVYFRIAQKNTLDYGNIEVSRLSPGEQMFPSSMLMPSDAFALARVGRYSEIFGSGSGIFKHLIGKYMWINKAKFSSLSLIQKKNILMHEFGHSVGFLHTSTQEVNIEGTSRFSTSIFNNRDGIFRDEDLLAIDRIFNVPVEFFEMQGVCD